jgi:co-chaperonin GroES (HSP10)
MKLIPMPGWALCKAVAHATQTTAGIIIPGDIDKNVTSEGVAEVVRVGDPHVGPAGVEPGDKVIYRGFLRFANQVGNIHGSTRDCEFFLINLRDILAVVEGSGTVGINGEYRV